MTSDWYVETWDKDGIKARDRVWLPAFAEVRTILKGRSDDEIVRVRAPIDASKDDLEELQRFGAERMFDD